MNRGLLVALVHIFTFGPFPLDRITLWRSDEGHLLVIVHLRVMYRML